MARFISEELTIFLLLLGWLGLGNGRKNFDENPADPDLLLDPEVLLQKHGYPVEIHEITTDDGYLLTVFRVPHGKNGSGINKKPIVMMHGLFGSAYNFVFTEYFNMSMAGYFADHGYDVWLANTRGTVHCRKHVRLDPNRSKFWKFSWHEIALHDLPATVDYILSVTERNNLYYVGHSQGGTVFYVLASLLPEYQKKFAQVSLLAPGALMANYDNPFILPLVRNYKLANKIMENAKLYELPPPWLNIRDILATACVGTLLQNFCEYIFFIVNGGDSGEVDTVLLPMLIRTLPSVATMQALHYAQNIYVGKFRQYDYGKKKNLIIYGQVEPPEYPVDKIENYIAIYYGNGDNEAFPKDQEEMCRRLKNCYKYKMPNPKWNHFDFLLSSNLEKELFIPVMEYMETYELL